MESIETVITLFTIGVALLLTGIARQSERRHLLQSGIRVDGVIQQIINTGNGNNATYYPVVNFTTVDEDLVTEKYRIGANRYSYKEGETVKVIYNPLDPGRFMLDDARSNRPSGVFVYGGIALLIVSIGLLLLGLRG